MKRRNFITGIAGLIALPSILKAQAPADPRSQITPKQKLWRAYAESIHTGKSNSYFEEWMSSGVSRRINFRDEAAKDSFVVEYDIFRHSIEFPSTPR